MELRYRSETIKRLNNDLIPLVPNLAPDDDDPIEKYLVRQEELHLDNPAAYDEDENNEFNILHRILFKIYHLGANDEDLIDVSRMPTIQIENLKTALTYILENDQDESLMVANESDIMPAQWAALINDPEVLTILLENGHTLTYDNDPEDDELQTIYADENDAEPYLYAIYKGNLETLKVIINHMKELGITYKDPLDQSLLHHAAACNQKEICKYLIDNGICNISQPDYFCKTALEYASEQETQGLLSQHYLHATEMNNLAKKAKQQPSNTDIFSRTATESTDTKEEPETKKRGKITDFFPRKETESTYTIKEPETKKQRIQ